MCVLKLKSKSRLLKLLVTLMLQEISRDRRTPLQLEEESAITMYTFEPSISSSYYFAKESLIKFKMLSQSRNAIALIVK